MYATPQKRHCQYPDCKASFYARTANAKYCIEHKQKLMDDRANARPYKAKEKK